jgi:ribosome maturation factor RimP
MSRNPLHQRLIAIVEPAVQAAGYELVDLRFVLEQGGWTLRVQIDFPLPAAAADRHVDLSACEAISRELSAVLDVEDPIPQAYSLEVSSPGIDRPLRTEAHFAHFTGREAKIALAVPLQSNAPVEAGARRNFKGILRGVADHQVLIECDGHTFALPVADIDHAKLVPDWDAVMHKHDKPDKHDKKQKHKH